MTTVIKFKQASYLEMSEPREDVKVQTLSRRLPKGNLLMNSVELPSKRDAAELTPLTPKLISWLDIFIEKMNLILLVCGRKVNDKMSIASEREREIYLPNLLTDTKQ